MHKLCLLIAALALPALAQNALVNGDFEKRLDGWTVWGGEVTKEARSGSLACQVVLANPAWAGVSQSVAVPEGMNSVRVSGWLESIGIRGGKENWERGRISVELFGAKGDTVGGNLLAVGQVRGKMGWTRMERTYPLPPEAKTVKIGCALGNSTGTLHCDDLSVEFLP